MDEHALSPSTSLASGLARIRRRWFVFVWLRIAATWGAAMLVVLAAVAAAVLMLRPTGGALVAAMAVVPLLAVAVLASVAGAWWRRPSDRQVARYAEERCPELEERLVSAADVAASGRTPTAVEAMVIREGARAVSSLDLDRVLPRRHLVQRGAIAAGALAAVLVGGVLLAPQARRAWQTARALWFPATLSLRVEPGDARVVEGGSLAIRAYVDGASPGEWETPVVLQSTAPHLQRPIALELRDGSFAGQVGVGGQSFSYRVTSGRLASREYHVSVRRPPRVDRLSIRYEYPAFSGMAPRIDEDSGDIFAPAGTKLTVQVRTVDPVAAGALGMAEAGKVPLVSRGERLLEGEFVLKADDAYRVSLADAEGLSSEGDVEYFVRVMEDRPPDVRIIRPGGDAKVTRVEEVTIEARADDDFGVSRFELVYAPRGGQERVVPLSRGGSTSVTGQHTIFVEDLDVKPGDFVTYYARARDVSRGKRSTETRSDIFFLEVRPFNEEFEAAQSQAGFGGADGNFDDLARLQKDIIVATWRLDRRRTGGQSAQDVRAVAKSQADVQARATRVAQQAAMSRPQSGRPSGRPQPGQPPMPVMPQVAQDNPMQRAVEAMGRAQKALEGLDTSGALPHENEALNEILRAQAEVRRRQVARQQNSRGGRGGQSGNQDLSALFDRELQRQQQTNYEQRATSEQQQKESPQDESLRRLRELAARQDELNREQRELARRRAQLTTEEMKRRLERLTRDQEELRRQAEDLAKRLQQQGQQGQQGQSGQQGQQGQQGQRAQSGAQQGASQQSTDARGSQAGASGDQAGARGSDGEGRDQSQRLREAAQEMANASGALRRDSPENASARSERALERLRAAERGAAGARPDEQRRRAGDLQSEARQLAEAERRLAAEAGTAGADPEALRRLAGQQARLAERAEALERGTRELAGRAGQDGASRGASGRAEGEKGNAARQAETLRRAAGDLSREKLGQRLRDSAQAANQPGDGAGQRDAAARQLAGAARDAAQPLDRLADALSQATGQDAESRKLSDDLARARGLRDRLAEADRQSSEGSRPGGQSQPQGGQPHGQRQGASGQRADASTSASGQPSAQSGGQQASSSSGAQGAGGGRGQGTDGARGQERLLQELRQRRDLLDALQRENPALGGMMASLEGWTPSRSAPGTEAWKQDYARWDELKKQMSLALERYESSVSAKLAAREARDRLDAGADDRPPEQWRQEIADYFRAIARKPRP